MKTTKVTVSSKKGVQTIVVRGNLDVKKYVANKFARIDKKATILKIEA